MEPNETNSSPAPSPQTENSTGPGTSAQVAEGGSAQENAPATPTAELAAAAAEGLTADDIVAASSQMGPATADPLETRVRDLDTRLRAIEDGAGERLDQIEKWILAVGDQMRTVAASDVRAVENAAVTPQHIDFLQKLMAHFAGKL